MAANVEEQKYYQRQQAVKHLKPANQLCGVWCVLDRKAEHKKRQRMLEKEARQIPHAHVICFSVYSNLLN